MNLLKLKKIWALFWSFFKIGAFTFGGGYAMIPLIQKETVENKKWITDDDILNIVAIAESTPGPIAINMATFVGYKACGVAGALSATLGTALPSFVIISIISYALKEFQSIKSVSYAFYGIRAGVLALIIKALVNMYKKIDKNVFSYIIMIFAFLSAVFLDINVLIIILICAISGISVALIGKRIKNGEKGGEEK